SAILSSLNDFITIHEPDGTMTYLGAAAERTLSPADTEKFREGELLHPDDLPRVLEAIAEVANHQRRPNEPVEFRIRDAAGSYRVLEASGQDLRETPTIGGILVISRDITERMQAEAQRREGSSLLASLVGTLPDGVLFLDQFGNVEFANQPLCTLIGIPLLPEDIVGQNLFKDFQDELARLFDSQIEAIVERIEDFHRQGVPQSVEVPLGESIIECVYRAANLLSGEPGHLWLLRDVTERRRATERRHQLLAQERELRQAVEATNRSLVDLAELKNAFVATVAHELRTPLTSVVSFTELLLDDGAEFSGEHQEFLATIHRNANRLLYLVGDLLLLAQMESGGYELDSSPIDLAHLIDEVAASLAPQAASSFVDLQVATESGPSISLDVLRMEQVLLNILTNAIKFTHPGGCVSVKSWFDEDTWIVAVQDSGIGIPEDEQDRLFQRFFRASNTAAARMPGTGLGLVISRVIVELHGGEISLESVLGEGTTVTIVLPTSTSSLEASEFLSIGGGDD
ncbi:MAG: PAS domain-containing sensor histidine kinase, partial [Actinomycetota bacterium]